ncbi:hypothetical protein JB92DRAFT_3037673 [Gautieria morchelliformis]|nr:hypothetical protein JB92DRAFT_3037673 [Gautieria morchelliformis]
MALSTVVRRRARNEAESDATRPASFCEIFRVRRTPLHVRAGEERPRRTLECCLRAIRG